MRSRLLSLTPNYHLTVIILMLLGVIRGSLKQVIYIYVRRITIISGDYILRTGNLSHPNVRDDEIVVQWVRVRILSQVQQRGWIVRTVHKIASGRFLTPRTFLDKLSLCFLFLWRWCGVVLSASFDFGEKWWGWRDCGGGRLLLWGLG